VEVKIQFIPLTLNATFGREDIFNRLKASMDLVEGIVNDEKADVATCLLAM
jgi:hypothetical protein